MHPITLSGLGSARLGRSCSPERTKANRWGDYADKNIPWEEGADAEYEDEG